MNIQHRMLNKVFCQFIESVERHAAQAPALRERIQHSMFDVERSMFDVHFFNLYAL